jgi:pimeloyl-ACP methyl ester carboxylesterase
MDTDPETISRGIESDWPNDREQARHLCSQVKCPSLVVQGSEDSIVGPASGAAVAGAVPGARLITLEGSGHAPQLRIPVKVNLLIREFVESLRTTEPAAAAVAG